MSAVSQLNKARIEYLVLTGIGFRDRVSSDKEQLLPIDGGLIAK